MKKKPLMALGMLTVVGVVGATYAYFADTAVFTNIFKTKKFTTTIVEEFESPEDWKPGDTTDKKLTITNTGNVDLVARVKLEEKWEALDPESAEVISLSLANGEKVAIWNFSAGFATNWKLTRRSKDTEDYYYYNGTIKEGETVNFLDSVTFNPNAGEGTKCDVSEERNESGVVIKTTRTCTSGYANAKYTLTATVDTLQADAADEVWGTLN